MALIISSKQRIIEITSPVNEDILTVSVAATITVYAPSETAIQIYKDSTLLGSATDIGGGYWEYSYTPSSIDYTGFYLKAYGVYSNFSVGTFVFVAEANAINTDITAWTKSLGTGGTVVGGITDPYGGTNAYEVKAAASAGTSRSITSPTMSPAMTEFNHGLDVWVALKAVSDVTTIYFQSLGGVYLDLTSGQAYAANSGGAYVKIVARVTVNDPTVGDIEWLRVRVRREGKSSVSTSWQLPMCNDIPTGTAATVSTDDGYYIFEPRSLDGIVPFTTFEKANFHYNSASGGVEEWRLQHPYCSDVSIMSSGYRVVQVVKPTAWSITGNHECCIMLPARIDALETTPPQDLVAAAGDADTYNCVFICPMDDSQTFACREDGTVNGHAVVGELLSVFRTTYFGCKGGRTARVIGYSKTAVTAFSLLMNYPDVFAKAAGWDGVWDCYRQWDEVSPPAGQIQGSLVFSLGCTTKAQFANYDALTLLDSKIDTINDAKRLVLAGYSQWNYYLAPFKAELDSRSIEYDYENTNRASHEWSSGWVPSVLAYLMADVV